MLRRRSAEPSRPTDARPLGFPYQPRSTPMKVFMANWRIDAEARILRCPSLQLNAAAPRRQPAAFLPWAPDVILLLVTDDPGIYVEILICAATDEIWRRT